jgi:protein O-mannosyl-transferase
LLILISVGVAVAHRRYLLVGWFWFLGTLVPMIGLVQVGVQAMADRYAYLPFVGLYLMVCWGTAELAERKKWPAALPPIAAVIVLVVLGAIARRQLSYWSDSITLWSHAIAVTGPNFEGQEHLGSALAAQGRMAEAGAHFAIGEAINPNDPVGNFNLAVYDQGQGKVQQAIGGYNAVLRLSPDLELRGKALENLAAAYRQAGNYSQSETTYRAAVLADPQNHRTWLGAGLLEQKMGKFDEAAQAFAEAAALEASAVDYLLLESALAHSGQRSESLAAHKKAVQLSPDLRRPQQIADSLLAQ